MLNLLGLPGKLGCDKGLDLLRFVQRTALLLKGRYMYHGNCCIINGGSFANRESEIRRFDSAGRMRCVLYYTYKK